jgi:menaquinone-dependent protoporphyrinogen oxidase
MYVLVTAASKHGSAAEIAGVIAAVLRTADIEVDVVSPDAVDRLDAYDAVVVGSAVYAGQWLDPAISFVERHAADLRERPTFLFSSGPLGDPPKPLEEPAVVADLDDAAGAVDHRVFAGRLTQSQLSRPERFVTRLVRAPYGDFRPWDDIADWAKEIARFLTQEKHRAEVAAG